jgi:hypothetical protein
MKTVDKAIAARLWENVKGDIERYCEMVIVRPGIKADKGEKKAETLCKLVIGMMHEGYSQALNTGYDMGFSVFGDGEREA